jgi:hypothetical protein
MNAARWCFLLISLSGCAGRPPGATEPPPTASPPSRPNAVSRMGCGPTDGPAIGVRIFDGISRCEEAKTAELRADVGVWSGMLPEPGSVLRLDGEAGSASLCPRGECQSIHGAELTVTERRADGWTGVLRWTDAAGRHELSIRALDCPSEPIMCG